MKTINVIRKDGTLVLKKMGNSMDVINLATAFQTDRINHDGDVTEIILRV
ncbi:MULTISPECIES: hypothetical protein [unclassified Cohnella]|nr:MULTISPECIES: hypothetical protein [unclassified Cohnella]